MKVVFIEKHQTAFTIKAMYRVLQVARSGWYAWRSRRCQITSRQQFRLICDEAVRNAFAEAKQRYGAPRFADELPEYNIKTIAASCVVRDCGQKPAVNSVRSATVNMACQYRKTC